MLSKLVFQKTSFKGVKSQKYCVEVAKAPRVRATHVFRQPARPLGERKETILVQKEKDDQDKPDFKVTQQKQANEHQWLGHNVYLKQLLKNKNYAHGFDYWKTLRKFGPKPDTETYNIYFALVEAAGSPYEIIETFYDFDETNLLRVEATPDATTYAYLIKAYCTIRDLPAAKAVLQKVMDSGFTPTQRSYAMILDLCTELNLFDEGTPIIEAINFDIVDKQLDMDIELRNAMMFFYGSKDLSEGEKYFHSLIRDEVKISYNTYQRLIELYIKHEKPEDVARMIHLMKNDGLIPDDELTKYTLMQAFIETGHPLIMNSLAASYKRETFQREPYFKFFYDFCTKYYQGGGPLYIPEGYIDIATEDELEALYLRCMAKEMGGQMNEDAYFQLDDYGDTSFDVNKIIEDDLDDIKDTEEMESQYNEALYDGKKRIVEFKVEEGEVEKIYDKYFGEKNGEEEDVSGNDYEYETEDYDNEGDIINSDEDSVGRADNGNEGKPQSKDGKEEEEEEEEVKPKKRKILKLPKMPKLDDNSEVAEEEFDESVHFEPENERYLEIMSKIAIPEEDEEEFDRKQRQALLDEDEEEEEENQASAAKDENFSMFNTEDIPDVVKEVDDEQERDLVEKKLQRLSERIQSGGEKSLHEEDQFLMMTPEEKQKVWKEEIEQNIHVMDDVDKDMRNKVAEAIGYDGPEVIQGIAPLALQKIEPDSPSLKKEKEEVQKEFEKRFGIDPEDPIIKEINGGLDFRIPDEYTKKQPSELEVEKAEVRKLYLNKIKRKYQAAKAQKDKKLMDKYRADFETVKKIRISDKEVDNYESKMELYLHKMQFENPKAYKALFAQYRMEVFNDRSAYEDADLVEDDNDPVAVFDAQLTAISDFYDDMRQPDDDNIFIDAVRQFDHRNPDDPEMKRLVLRWAKNNQEKESQDLGSDMLRTRMASINVLAPNPPIYKTGHPDDPLLNDFDEEDDYNYL